MKNLNLLKSTLCFRGNRLWQSLLLLVALFSSSWFSAQIFPVAGTCTAGLGSTIYAPASSSAPLSTSRHVAIYPASQVAGIVGQTLTSLYLYKITAATMTGTPNLKIYLKDTSSIDFDANNADWATLIAGATKVYDANPTRATAGAAGAKQLVFSTNYLFNSTNNLMILFEYVNTGNNVNSTWEYEYTAPCVVTTNNNTTKYINTTDGILGDILNSSNYRRPRIGFDYLVACPAPSGLNVSNITTNSATATWTAGGSETSWDYVIKPAGGGGPSTFTNTTSTTINESGLLPNTSYDLYVRAVCGGTNGNSSWKGPFNFKTACGATTTMYEGFESTTTGNVVPDCCVRLATTNSGSQTVSASSPASGIRNIYQNASTTQTPVIVALPVFSNVNAGTHWLRFKARATAAGGSLTVGYVTDISNMNSFSSIEELTINNTLYTTADAEYKVIIPTSVPSGARLAIVNKADGKSYYWDDIYWEAIPTCTSPTSLTTSNITATSGTVSWTAPATTPANGYDVYFSTTSTAPTVATTPNANSSTTSYVLSGLNPCSTYYVWVRSRCSNTEQSSWAGYLLLTTGSGTLNVPYIQDFESATVPAMPNCTSTQNVGTGNNWVTENAPGNGFTSKTLKYNYSSSSAANAWFYTPGINLSAGVTYKISFDYGNNDTNPDFTPEKLKVAYGTSAVNTDMTNTIVDLPNINDATKHTGTYTFSVTTTGVYYFGFNVYSDADKFYLYVDNIKIEENNMATAEVSTKDAITISPNPFQDVVNISNARDVKMINVMDASGRLVKTIEKPSNQINLGDLKPGLYILQLVHKDGTTTSLKAMKK